MMFATNNPSSPPATRAFRIHTWEQAEKLTYVAAHQIFAGTDRTRFFSAQSRRRRLSRRRRNASERLRKGINQPRVRGLGLEHAAVRRRPSPRCVAAASLGRNPNPKLIGFGRFSSGRCWQSRTYNPFSRYC